MRASSFPRPFPAPGCCSEQLLFPANAGTCSWGAESPPSRSPASLLPMEHRGFGGDAPQCGDAVGGGDKQTAAPSPPQGPGSTEGRADVPTHHPARSPWAPAIPNSWDGSCSPAPCSLPHFSYSLFTGGGGNKKQLSPHRPTPPAFLVTIPQRDGVSPCPLACIPRSCQPGAILGCFHPCFCKWGAGQHFTHMSPTPKPTAGAPRAPSLAQSHGGVQGDPRSGPVLPPAHRGAELGLLPVPKKTQKKKWF